MTFGAGVAEKKRGAEEKGQAHLPLAGVRVVDFTTILAGPHLTQWLAVLGAEVIKIETHLRAESRLVSVVAKTPRVMGLNESDSFAIHNYSKRSITLNMKQPEAVNLARRLIAKSDVVAENFGGAVMDRWGLGWNDLTRLRPGVILYSGSGYGRTGPRKSDPIYAPVADAQTGCTILNGYPDGDVYTLGSSGWTDMAMAMHGAAAILAALRHRTVTGEGQYIDTAMVEVEAQFLADLYLQHQMTGRNGVRMGNGHAWMAPHGCYPCAGDDQWIAIACSSQSEWLSLCGVLAPGLADDPAFADELIRWDNRNALDQAIADLTRCWDKTDLAQALRAAGAPATPSMDFIEVVNDPQLAHRQFFRDMPHKAMGNLHFAGMPFRLSRVGEGAYTSSPLLGEDNDYVFCDLLGLDPDEVRRLEREQVLY